jgi:outer membrane lipopolysaccharide assembly protein LptE/RlpB
MKINEWQLLGLVVGAFALVIALDIFVKYQSDAEMRESFTRLPTMVFGKRRASQMIEQEMTPQHPAEPTFADEDSPSEES